MKTARFLDRKYAKKRIKRKQTSDVFQKAFADLPECMVGGGCDDATTIADLISVCRTQLDLIAEGQDGTEDDDPKAIGKWLKKWA